MCHVTLDRLDEVRHEIGTLLELDIDLRPSIVDAVRKHPYAVDKIDADEHDENYYSNDCKDYPLNIHLITLGEL
jgi:hypothetical protein